MKEVVLITGGSGLLALNWALAARDRYSVVLGLHGRTISLSGVDARRISLESLEGLLEAFEEIKPDIVVHTAGLTNIEDCESSPDLARYVNVGLAQNVAKACARRNLPMVHISTDHLFSGDSSMLDERIAVAPQNVYGCTKAEAELQVLAACPTALVVRTNFFCWGPSYRHSFSDTIISALRQRATITLFQDVYFTPILAEVLVHAVHELVERDASGVFNIVGDDRISKFQFGVRLAERFKLDASLIRSGRLADRTDLVRRPLDMSLSNQKVTNMLGARIGGLAEHLTMLYQQESDSYVREIQQL